MPEHVTDRHEILVIGAGPRDRHSARRARASRARGRARAVSREIRPRAPHTLLRARLCFAIHQHVQRHWLRARVPVQPAAVADRGNPHRAPERLWRFVERGTTVLSIEENPDALDVRLRGPGGEIETASFRYVLGAGGAHDLTRGSMHDSLSGDTYAGRYIAADICTGLPHEPEESMIFASHEGFVLLAPLPENHWITFVDLDPDPLDIDQKDTHELAQGERAPQPPDRRQCRRHRSPVGLTFRHAQTDGAEARRWAPLLDG
jgi:hypothetical protein